MTRRRFNPRNDVGVACQSHPGHVRRSNEDSYGYFEHPDDESFSRRGRLAVVADGMGGEAAGEIASSMTVRILRDAYYGDAFLEGKPVDALDQAIQTAHDLIVQEARRDVSKQGMGSTVTALLLRDGVGWAAHVGDSRLYLFRRGFLRQVTTDHSQVWSLMQGGVLSQQDARAHPLGSALYRSLGADQDELDVDRLGPIQLYPGDRFLLCSDGLTDMLEDETIAAALGAHDVELACERLVEQARKEGGKDNITVQLLAIRDVKLDGSSPEPAVPRPQKKSPVDKFRRHIRSAWNNVTDRS